MAWLYRQHTLQRGGILADDMGLAKVGLAVGPLNASLSHESTLSKFLPQMVLRADFVLEKGRTAELGCLQAVQLIVVRCVLLQTVQCAACLVRSRLLRCMDQLGAQFKPCI